MFDNQLNIFFSGIGGSGVSALADFMADKGHKVAGSDRAFDANPKHPLLNTFRQKGIKIYSQDGTGIDSSLDLAVFSTAVETDNPEIVKAGQLQILTKTRPEFLADIVSSFETIAVAGTSGKSTTSGMLTYVMSELGLSPNLIGGGRVKQFMADSRTGNAISGASKLLIVEACESDGSIVHYAPEHTVILNLNLDHHSVSETTSMFRKLIDNTKGIVILNADDENMQHLITHKSITFSVNSPSSFRATDIHLMPLKTEFLVNGVHFELQSPGRHNLLNALACIAMLSSLGFNPEDAARHLRNFSGIVRRFDVIMDDGHSLVIDDYAHNPHKIGALMETMKNIRESICYIFQPHGYGPTRLMKDRYIDTFSKHLRPSDHLILLPIYYAGGTATRDISSVTLAEGIAASGCSVEVAEGRDAVLCRLDEWRNYVVFGARDETLSDFARDIASRLDELLPNK